MASFDDILTVGWPISLFLPKYTDTHVRSVYFGRNRLIGQSTLTASFAVSSKFHCCVNNLDNPWLIPFFTSEQTGATRWRAKSYYCYIIARQVQCDNWLQCTHINSLWKNRSVSLWSQKTKNHKLELIYFIFSRTKSG